MRTLPTMMIRFLAPFAPLFSKCVWQNAQVLLMGAILAPGQRTVSSALRAMGLDQLKRFHRYHRVLSRAEWSNREASRILLGLLIEAFVPQGPLVFGIDETLERRWGKKISAKGVYRDPVRSSYENFVKTSGLRWVCMMLLVEIPWTTRVWALPFLSALAPSERYAAARGKRHKKITDWAWQLLLQVRHWHPEREIVAVADSTYASLKLLFRCQSLSWPVSFITRLRLDAALYEPAPPRRPGQIGRPRLKGERPPNLSVVAEDRATVWKSTTLANWYGSGESAWLKLLPRRPCGTAPACSLVPVRWVLVRDPQGQFKTQALLCTDLNADPHKILSWFVMRWQLEATFQEARRHLGFETQRQWSDLAIRRTTPALLGLFSLVTLFAHCRMTQTAGAFRRAAWYHKRHPTFTDALALVRKELWAQEETFYASSADIETVKVPRAFMERLTNAVCYAA
jgi:DDE superfamily endonuclease